MTEAKEEKHFYMATQADRKWAYLFKSYNFHFITHCEKCGEELVLSKVIDWGYIEWDTLLIYSCRNNKWWHKILSVEINPFSILPHNVSKFHVMLLNYNSALKELKTKGTTS